MKKLRSIILCALLVLAAACTPNGIISKDKMARIQADMFLFDQYAASDRTMRRFTDTCAVYKALLRSYGCTAEQYTASADYYLQNSRDMQEVMDKTEKILQKRKEKILKNIEKGASKRDSTMQSKDSESKLPLPKEIETK